MTPARKKRSRPRAPRSLRQTLAYENSDVLDKFRMNYAVPARQAKELFLETKRWLWLIARGLHRGEDRKAFFVTDHLAAMDEMWHTFVLFSGEYHDFCERYLGRYIHHVPTTQRERLEQTRLLARDPQAHQRWSHGRWVKQLGYIREELDDATISRWYVKFPQRYSLAYLNEVRTPLGGSYRLSK